MMRKHYTVTGLFVLLAMSVWFIDSVLDYYVFLGGSFADLTGREFAIRAVASGSILVLGIIVSMAFSADRRVRDEIARRKQSEEEREALRQRLQQSEKLESLALLAGGVAHDLNNTLVPLVSHAELMLRELPAESPLRRRIEAMGNAAEDAGEIIQDLLTLARRGKYDMKPTDLNAVVRSYLESPAYLHLRDRSPGVHMELALEKGMAPLSGSRAHLDKALMNLVINAYDAMPDGGTLSITTSQVTLDRLLGGHAQITPGDYLMLRVRDTGTGIRAESVAQVFEPYYSDKPMGKCGTGLGLAVVYGVLMDHGGYYDIFSTPSQGTEFILYFPACADEAPVDDVRPSPDALLGQGETILVVDDLQTHRALAAEVLESLNYRVTLVGSGQEAISKLREDAFDLVLLDMVMEQDLDGLETFLEIVRLSPRQKVLIVSACANNDSVRRMQSLGAGAFIEKPYTRETLGRALRKQLDSTPATLKAAV